MNEISGEIREEASQLFEEWWQENGDSELMSKQRMWDMFLTGYSMNTKSMRDAAEQIAENMAKMPSYQDLCQMTEAPVTPQVIARAINVIRDLHGLIGMVTEVGETLDAYKRHIFYGATLDRGNVAEELGDISWYMALLFNVHHLKQGNVQAANIEKLRKRYADKFTEEAALNRDLVGERKVLDSIIDGILAQDDAS